MPEQAARPSPTKHYRTLLGFDHGGARIGVAVGEELTCSARPLCTLRAQKGKPDWAELQHLLGEWRPDLLIVGIPRHADGSASKSTVAALAFCTQLQAQTDKPVLTIDERLSSHEAEQRLARPSPAMPYASRQRASARRKTARPSTRQIQEQIDQAAAAVILETWLQQHHRIT